MNRGRAALIAGLAALAVAASPARADDTASWPEPSPDAARATLRLAPAEMNAIAGRLIGQRWHAIASTAIEIDDIAGEGRPWVGRVERRGADLVLVAATGDTMRLTGPLARPRLAGPGYTIWALGPIDADGGAMRVTRLGVLRPPAPR